MTSLDIQLLASLPDPYVVLSPADYRILYANPAYLKLINRSLDELTGRSVIEAFPNLNGQWDRLLSSLRACEDGNAHGLSGVRYPLQRHAQTGEYEDRFWDIINHPVCDDDGRIRFILNSPKDVTELYLRDVRDERAKKFPSMVERLGDIGGWSVNLSKQTVHLSDQAKRIHGIVHNLLNLKQAIALYAPGSQPLLWELFNRLINDGRPFDERLHIVRPDGTIRWVRLVGEKGDADNVHAHGAIQDITGIVQHEQALAASSQRFRALADAMPILVWTATAKGRINYCNKNFEHYAGVTQEQLLEGRWFHTIAKDDQKRVARAWRHAVKTRTVFEERVKLVDASTLKARTHLIRAVIVDEDNRTVSWYGTASDVHDIAALEEESAALARQLQSTFDSITDAFMVVDHFWRIAFLTDKAAALLERDRAELVGKDMWSEFAPALKTEFEHQYRKAVETRTTARFEAFYSPLKRWFSVSAYPSDQGLAIYFRDITREKQHLQIIAANEERLRAVANASVDTIYDWDAKTQKIWWSEGIERVFGRKASANEHLSDWEALVHPADRRRLQDRYLLAAASKTETLQLEYRLLDGRGQYRDVIDRSKLFYRNGELRRVVGGIRDVTDHNLAQSQLEQQAQLIEKSQDGVVVRTLDHKIALWNPSAERMYGWKAQETLGRSILDLGINDTDAFAAAQAAVLANGTWQGALEQRTRDGRPLHVEARWTLIKGTDSTPDRVLAVNTDRTEQKRLEANLHQAQKLEALGQLTGGVAHDFNNLLMIISGNAELLEDAVAHIPEVKEPVAMIVRAAAQGADLTGRLLSFGRRHPLQPEDMALSEFLAGIVKIWKRTLPDNIALEFADPAPDAIVRADQNQLELALLNLALNARDAMKKGGTLCLTSQKMTLEGNAATQLGVEPGRYVELTISDNGEGISPENLGRLFEPFFSTKPSGRGTGLGLSMVYGFLRQSGGGILVKSELGRGTTVRMYLPEGELRPTVSSPEEPLAQNLGGRRILAVDDNEGLLESLLRLLASLGMKGCGVANADEAIRFLSDRHEEFDLVLSDVVMPGSMSGIGLAEYVESHWPHIGVVLASGNLEHGGAIEDISRFKFLPKPFRRATLQKALLEAIR